MKYSLAGLLAALTPLAVTAQQMEIPHEKIEAAFSKADSNGNGTIDYEEAKRFGISVDAFNVANQDADNKLDRNEFSAAISYQFAAANPKKDGTLDWSQAQKAGIRSKKIFDAANPDHDSTLDVAEFLSALLAQAQAK
jgi:Ca2+-binding EF-hand superfamily protein